MPPQEIPTFYLYGKGYKPDELWLGHLVLGNYASPTHVPNCGIPPLRNGELKNWVNISPYSGTFTEGRGLSLKSNMEVFEAGNIGGGRGSEKSKGIQSDKGRRLELKNPRQFFQEKILSNPVVKENLKLWLSVSRCKYVTTRMRLTSKPKIWCLTGLIELENVTAFTVTKTNHSASIGISSALMGSLTGVPVGGSVDGGKDYTVNCESKNPENMVWLAQYQLVKVKPVVKKTPASQTPINYVNMYPDHTYARGAVLGDSNSKEEAFELELADVADQGGKVEGAMNEDYWKLYSDGERRMKEFLKVNKAAPLRAGAMSR